MIRNIDKPRTELIKERLLVKVIENTTFEVVDDFRYVGAYIENWHVDFRQDRGVA